MRLRITGRHLDITSALRSYVETRFGRLDRYELKIGSLQVVLGVEKLQRMAEVIGTVNGKPLQAKTSTREMYATIDALVDRVDAQFRKWKGRLVSHKSGGTRKSQMRATTSCYSTTAGGVFKIGDAAREWECRTTPISPPPVLSLKIL
ncbi:MAG: ribosome-associated translation inhibitor RaiA [Nitrospira sp.]|nr:ribosome-associated translation inhibitor RaiA [Nitrospira sp.]